MGNIKENTILRNLIREVLSEAFETSHFKDRVDDRIYSDNTTFKDEIPEIKDVISNSIKFLKNVNFPGQDNIGILIFKSQKSYKYEKFDYEKDKLEKSEGSRVWVVIRGNDLETLFFMPPGKKPQNTQVHLKIEDLRYFVDNVKGGNADLVEKDIERFKRANYGRNIVRSTKEKEKLKVFMVDGTKWVFDDKKEVVYQKNKPENKVSLYDVKDKFGEKVEQQILSLL